MMKFKKLMIAPAALSLFLFAGANLASAQLANAPRLFIELGTSNVATVINPGANNVILTNIRLDTTASSEDVRLNSLPIIVSAGNGGSASHLMSCILVPTPEASNGFNSGTNIPASLNSGSNVFTFDNTMTIPRNSITNVYLSCDVSSNLVQGSTYQFSINTANVFASGAATGLQAAVSAGRPGGIIPPPVVPGIPNTGAGGTAATNILLIVGSIVVAGLGLAYTRKAVR